VADVPGQLASALHDRYRIERELGAGGMATVYLARDLKHDREIALKVLRPELAAIIGAERFHQEIRVTAGLRHPNILPLYDSGEAGGLLYYVMPLVEGESLRTRMERQPPLTQEEALRVTGEVADALNYAHRHGVIHRDIKPENILLEDGHALVTDFGIARAATPAGHLRLTGAGLSLGTPLYMSPEQAAGDPDFDGRSDLYSLACVVYEMLAGEPPFNGPSPEAVLVQRFTSPPPHLSSIRASVSPAIDRALHRALARSPADRFATTQDFAASLNSPAAATPVEKSIAVLPFTCMTTETDTEYFGDGIAEEIINALTQLPGLKVAARTSSFSFKGKAEDLRIIGDKLGVSTVLEGSFRRAGNRVRVTAQLIEVATGYHLWSERYDRELNDIFAIQDEIANGIAAKLKVTLETGPREQLVKPGTADVEAYDLYLKGRAAMRHRGAELSQAIDWFEHAFARDPRFALAHAGLAQALALSAFWGISRSGEVRERAIAAANRALELDPKLPEAHHAIGFTALLFEYDREKSSRAWQQAVALDPGNPDSHILRGVFDLTYIRQDVEGAARELETAIAQDPESAYAYTSRAIALDFGRRPQQALPFAERAIQLDPNSLYAHWVRLLTLALLGRLEEVLTGSRQLSNRFGRHPWIIMGIALAAGVDDDRTTAEAAYQELKGRSALEDIQSVLLAVAALYAGRRDQAFEHLHAAVAERDAMFAALAMDWPGLDPILDTPEYDAVLRQMGWHR
jgi:TolB-like protein